MIATFTNHSRTLTIGRAPRGGIEFNGRAYKGGQFCPLAAVVKPICGGAPRGPVALEGSEKQISWAGEIRSARLAFADEMIEDGAEGFVAYRDWLASQGDAAFWIETRRIGNDALKSAWEAHRGGTCHMDARLIDQMVGRITVAGW